jgi:hypothetical protein
MHFNRCVYLFVPPISSVLMQHCEHSAADSACSRGGKLKLMEFVCQSCRTSGSGKLTTRSMDANGQLISQNVTLIWQLNTL